MRTKPARLYGVRYKTIIKVVRHLEKDLGVRIGADIDTILRMHRRHINAIDLQQRADRKEKINGRSKATPVRNESRGGRRGLVQHDREVVATG